MSHYGICHTKDYIYSMSLCNYKNRCYISSFASGTTLSIHACGGEKQVVWRETTGVPTSGLSPTTSVTLGKLLVICGLATSAEKENNDNDDTYTVLLWRFNGTMHIKRYNVHKTVQCLPLIKVSIDVRHYYVHIAFKM